MKDKKEERRCKERERRGGKGKETGNKEEGDGEAQDQNQNLLGSLIYCSDAQWTNREPDAVQYTAQRITICPFSELLNTS